MRCYKINCKINAIKEINHLLALETVEQYKFLPLSDVKNTRSFHDHDAELGLGATNADVVQWPVPVIVIKATKCLQKQQHKLNIHCVSKKCAPPKYV